MMINGSLSCCYFIITSAAATVATPITLPTSYWRSVGQVKIKVKMYV